MKSIGIWLTSFIVTSSVFAGMVYANAPDMAAATPTQKAVLGAPASAGASNETSLGDGVSSGGMASQYSMFQTGDTAQVVAQAYLDMWTELGATPEAIVLDRVTLVSVLDIPSDRAQGIIRNVSIIDRGDHRIVIPGVSDARQTPAFLPTDTPVPIPQTASSYMGQTTEDRGSVSFTANFMMNSAPKIAIAFYTKELIARGFKEVSGSKQGVPQGSQMQEYARGEEWVSVVSSVIDAQKDPDFSHVSVTHVRAFALPDLNPAKDRKE